MSDNLYTDIILPFPLGGILTYRVPPTFRSVIKTGARVVVQLGVRRFFSGVVYRIHDEMPDGHFDIKNIEAVLDNEPVVLPVQFSLWKWMADYYCCTWGEVCKAALPSALKLESQTRISIKAGTGMPVDLTHDEEALLNMLNEKGSVCIRDIMYAGIKKPIYTTLKLLLEKNAVVVEEKLTDSYKPKTAAFVALHHSHLAEETISSTLDKLKKAKKQLILFDFFLGHTIYGEEKKTSISKKELLNGSNSSEGTLKALIDKQILRIDYLETGRLDFTGNGSHSAYRLNKSQQEAFDKITRDTGIKPVLLHGVTASGKTEIYIKLIEEQLSRGKQVLYLVPEIGLSTQLIARLKKSFGNKAGIYHSKFSDAERVETWMNILNGQEKTYEVILGTRSSVFLPFSNLGLIIIDEEHDQGFKQFDPAPRYNARDTAVVLAQMHNAKVVMGTATPSFESYFNATTGKYILVKLTERFSNVSLPAIIIADVGQALRRKQMRSLLTPRLYDETAKALSNKEQVILFQNRRGFAPYIQCMNCGWVPKCRHCDVSLTYHKHLSELNCHYCGQVSHIPPRCGDCGSTDIRTKGFGTERIEEELKALFPQAAIARMDIDTTRSKNAFERLLYKFESRQTDILVGTQMVTKGLDFDNVSVVGILDADILLNYPDFRSFERSFQMMAQVSGRAGRKDKQGKVIIQTLQPQHPLLAEVVANNYEGLFNSQLEERRQFRYPPYYRLVKIVMKHKKRDRLDSAADSLASTLSALPGLYILGPEYPLISRIKDMFHKEIWIKLKRDNKLASLKIQIAENVKQIRSMPGNAGVVIHTDVDPL